MELIRSLGRMYSIPDGSGFSLIPTTESLPITRRNGQNLVPNKWFTWRSPTHPTPMPASYAAFQVGFASQSEVGFRSRSSRNEVPKDIGLSKPQWSRSSTGFADPAAEPVEIVRIGRARRRRGGALEKQAAQPLTILVLSDQFTHALA